jgi:hypothetical protein
MAKLRKRTKYIYTPDDSEIEYELRFGADDTNDMVFEKLTDGRAVIGYLVHDQDPSDPMENENFGHMICWHRRYTLGEKHSYEKPLDLWKDLAGDAVERIDTETDAELEEWSNANPQFGLGSKEMGDKADELIEKANRLIHEEVEKNYIVLPLYLYDHGGITMSTGSFGDKWDSGQVGYIYVSNEEVLENWSVKSLDDPVDYKDGKPPKPARERAIDLLEAEVEEYANYLEGDCWGTCVQVFDPEGKEIGDDDVVWGITGHEWAMSELKMEVKGTVEHLLKRDEDAKKENDDESQD